MHPPMAAAAVQDQSYPDIREAVRGLCAGFDSAYWQRVEEQNAFPRPLCRR